MKKLGALISCGTAGSVLSEDEDTGALKKELECMICYEQIGDHVLLPCGHGGYCGSCAHKLLSHAAPKRLCPLCREILAAVARVPMGTAVGAEGDVLEVAVAGHPPAVASKQSISDVGSNVEAQRL